MDKVFPYVFTKEDVIGNFKTGKEYENWLTRSLKNGKIKRVRKNLYVYVDHTGCAYASKFEIAGKICKDSFVALHSALEYYGMANQVYNEIVVGSSVRFNDFEFENIGYKHKLTNNYVGVVDIVPANIRITTLERTIIDCIANINRAGGIEEILNALDQIKVLEHTKLLEALESYNQVLLYQKTGYILEQYKEQIFLPNEFFEHCKNRLTNQVKYFLDDQYKDIQYNSTWKLMAPRNLKSHVNGGY